MTRGGSRPKILAIDTSCDDTSVSVLQGDRVLSHVVSSQISLHANWGGVVPMLARGEHINRIEVVILEALVRAGFSQFKASRREAKGVLAQKSYKDLTSSSKNQPEFENGKVKSYKSQEGYGNLVLESFLGKNNTNPGIDYVAVTYGPGLAVALEVGIEAAKQVCKAWQIPVISINHMEGHFLSGLLKNSNGMYYSKSVPSNFKLESGTLGFLISGNHTELVLYNNMGMYNIIGQTLDDAAGEAFDKFSVMIGFGYPGGAVVESLVENSYRNNILKRPNKFTESGEDYSLPIPMMKSGDLNFSFSGLKTAAMYKIKKLTNNGSEELSKKQIEQLAESFQNSVTQSLSLKLKMALEEYKPKYILTGGGVMANKQIRKGMRTVVKSFNEKSNANTQIIFPHVKFLSDNASMIGIAAYYSLLEGGSRIKKLVFTAKNIEQLDRDPSLELA